MQQPKQLDVLGRPKNPKLFPYALVLNMTAEQQAWLQQRAKKEGKPMGAVLRALVDEARGR